jgi:hypothetical protein
MAHSVDSSPFDGRTLEMMNKFFENALGEEAIRNSLDLFQNFIKSRSSRSSAPSAFDNFHDGDFTPDDAIPQENEEKSEEEPEEIGTSNSANSEGEHPPSEPEPTFNPDQDSRSTPEDYLRVVIFFNDRGNESNGDGGDPQDPRPFDSTDKAGLKPNPVTSNSFFSSFYDFICNCFRKVLAVFVDIKEAVSTIIGDLISTAMKSRRFLQLVIFLIMATIAASAVRRTVELNEAINLLRKFWEIAGGMADKFAKLADQTQRPF